MAEGNVLERELTERRRSVSAETISMSVGELTSLYRQGTLNVHPEFQRVFRWSNEQKTALVESILLGIPIPSIFVAVTEEQWELVDGVQRVSTLLELQGELRNADGTQRPPLVMQEATLLTSLAGYSWDGTATGKAFSGGQQLDIQTARIDVKLLKRDSSPQTKYDLFQRLNAQGSIATPQELRNCLIVSEAPEFLSKLEELAAWDVFERLVAVPDRLIGESYHHELVMRFLALHSRPSTSGIGSLHRFLDDEALNLSRQYLDDGLGEPIARFVETFEYIDKNANEDVFRRWVPSVSRFSGPFLIGAYEVIALGIGYRLSEGMPIREDLRLAAMELWLEHGGTSESKGRSAESRVANTLPLGRKLLAPSTDGQDALPLD